MGQWRDANLPFGEISPCVIGRGFVIFCTVPAFVGMINCFELAPDFLLNESMYASWARILNSLLPGERTH